MSSGKTKLEQFGLLTTISYFIMEGVANLGSPIQYLYFYVIIARVIVKYPSRRSRQLTSNTTFEPRQLHKERTHRRRSGPLPTTGYVYEEGKDQLKEVGVVGKNRLCAVGLIEWPARNRLIA